MKHFEMSEYEDFLKISLLVKSSLYDNTSDAQVKELNSLLKEFSDLKFGNKVSRKIKTKDGKVVDDLYILKHSKIFKNPKKSAISVKIDKDKKIKDEFTDMSVKDLITKLKEATN